MIARVRMEIMADETSGAVVLAEHVEGFMPAGDVTDNPATFIDAGLRLERLIEAARASTAEQIKDLTARIEDFS